MLDEDSENSAKIMILSPFDNFVIQRQKLKNIFKFDFQIECYLPETKRKYGYFCLPVLRGVILLGRLDCKTDRKKKVLYIKSIHTETEIDIRDMLATRLRSFAKFNGCHDIHWL